MRFSLSLSTVQMDTQTFRSFHRTHTQQSTYHYPRERKKQKKNNSFQNSSLQPIRNSQRTVRASLYEVLQNSLGRGKKERERERAWKWRTSGLISGNWKISWTFSHLKTAAKSKKGFRAFLGSHLTHIKCRKYFEVYILRLGRHDCYDYTWTGSVL